MAPNSEENRCNAHSSFRYMLKSQSQITNFTAPNPSTQLFVIPPFCLFASMFCNKVKIHFTDQTRKSHKAQRFVYSRKCHVTFTLNAFKLHRFSMNSSQHCLSPLAWFTTRIATHIRAENRREEENKLLAWNWAQSGVIKGARLLGSSAQQTFTVHPADEYFSPTSGMILGNVNTAQVK